MARETIRSLIAQLIRDGYEQKAILSAEEMTRFERAFEAQRNLIDTPPAELRYIEGLVNLPFGYLKRFKVLPAERHACPNGRTPTALEIVVTALRRRVHDQSLIRDTLIGFENIVEIARDGRQGECIACGRLVIMRSYFTHHYMYAGA